MKNHKRDFPCQGLFKFLLPTHRYLYIHIYQEGGLPPTPMGFKGRIFKARGNIKGVIHFGWYPRKNPNSTMGRID